MNEWLNPWELGDGVSEKKTIEKFVKGKFIVTKILPPKNKTVREGLVVTAALLSYINAEGTEVVVTNLQESPAGYLVEFPLGKHLVTATKFRGPKSWYQFINPETGKWTKIDQEKFTVEYATDLLAKTISGWSDLSTEEKEMHIDTYFEDMYMFGLARDFNLKGTQNVEVGMITDFYRRYTPAKEGEKYGNIIITKWPDKKSDNESNFAEIDGSFTKMDPTVADAIMDAVYAPAITPSSTDNIAETNDDNDDLPF